jgi:dipeptide/tripeptide permease
LYGGNVISWGTSIWPIPTIATFYLGLGLRLVFGTGFSSSPTWSTMVGQLYPHQEDTRRDAEFLPSSIQGINLGAFVLPAGLRLAGSRVRNSGQAWHEWASDLNRRGIGAFGAAAVWHVYSSAFSNT